MPFGADIMFTLVPMIVIGGFVFIIGSAIYRAVTNSQQPLLTRRARIVGRRQRLSRGANHHHAHTAHFVTFEFEDGTREEFSMRGDEYAMLAEGDVGTLQSQGTWFKGFHREMNSF